MTGLTASAIRAVRQRFGDDADAILALRAAHKTVRPFGDGYAVDEQPVDSAELQRMADAVVARGNTKAKRTKQKTAGLGNPSAGKGAGTTDRPDGPGSALAEHSDAAPDGCVDVIDVPPATTPQTDDAANASVTPAHEAGELGAGTNQKLQGPMPNAGDGGETAATRCRPSPSIMCPCTRPRGHGGRCWHMRGEKGPTTTRAQPRGGICAGCAGPRSRSAVGDLCRKCVLAKVRRTSGLPARIAALEARQAAFEAIVRAAVAELLERIDNLTGEGR